MADKYWVGQPDVSCSFSDANNWATTIGGAPGAGIANTNDAYILNSTSIIDSGLTNAALTLASLTIRGGSPAIGTSTTSLSLAAITGAASLTYAPTGGELYISPGTVTGRVSAPESSGNLYISGGTLNGDINLGRAGASTIAGVTFGASSRLFTAGYSCTIAAGISSVPFVSISPGGVVNCSSPIASVTVCANSSLTLLGAATVTTSAVVWGTLRTQSTGTITLLDVRAGGSATSQGSPWPFTITASRREPDTYFFDRDSNQPTLSAPTVLAGY
jgi:hypothetical protein